MKAKLLFIGFLIIFSFQFSKAENFWEPTSGPNGGNISKVYIDDNNNIYLSFNSVPTKGIISKGLNFSSDNGLTWLRIDNAFDSTITGFYVSPDGFIYVSDFYSIYKSSDKGASWNVYCNFDSLEKYIYNFQVINNENILLNNHRGYKFYDNSQKKWSGFPFKSYYQIKLYNDTDNNYYFNDTTNIYKSQDSGKTWISIKYLDSLRSSFIDMKNNLYAISGRYLYYSSSGGTSWDSTLFNDSIHLQPIRAYDFKHIYFKNLDYIDPDEPFILYLYDLEKKKFSEITLSFLTEFEYDITLSKTGNIYLSSKYNGLFISSDFGVNWSDSKNSSPSETISKISSRNNMIFCGSDQNNNLYFSEDGGNTWKNLMNIKLTSFNTYGHNLGLYMTSQNYLYASQSTIALPVVFRKVNNTDTLEVGGPFFYYMVENSKGRLFNIYFEYNEYSDDQINWKVIPNGEIMKSNKPSIDKDDNIYLYTAEYNNITSDSIVIRKYNSISLKFTSFKKIITEIKTDVFLGTFGNGELIIFYNDSIFKSMNDGDSWAYINNNLPKLLINDILIDEQNIIWLATSIGVYRSQDRGYSWLEQNSGLKTTNALTISNNGNGTLYLGLAGEVVYRSKYYLDVPESKEQNPEIDAYYYDGKIHVKLYDNIKPISEIIIYDMLGNKIVNLINQEPDKSNFEIDDVNLSSGLYLCMLKTKGNSIVKKIIIME
jgi:hypothetical protein